MIQPIVKLRFVERYCPPSQGWSVFVDIDPSEEGRTGSTRQSAEARERQFFAQRDAPRARKELERLGAFVGDRSRKWKAHFGATLPIVQGDRDIIAVHQGLRVLWIAEVEGDSGGQPEGKIYKAIGQLVIAASECRIPEFRTLLTVVVWGGRLQAHLARAAALVRMDISGLAVRENARDDHWLFGRPDHLG